MSDDKPTKDDVIKDLICFFMDEFSNDPSGVGDWMAQGRWDADDFITAVEKLRKEINLRD